MLVQVRSVFQILLAVAVFTFFIFNLRNPFPSFPAAFLIAATAWEIKEVPEQRFKKSTSWQWKGRLLQDLTPRCSHLCQQQAASPARAAGLRRSCGCWMCHSPHWRFGTAAWAGLAAGGSACLWGTTPACLWGTPPGWGTLWKMQRRGDIAWQMSWGLP